MRFVLLAVLAAALFVPAAIAAPPVLKGTVGPGFTITLTKAGVTVHKLKAGRYVFKISDKSGIHNFHLKGPGIDKKTAVGFQGTVTWRLRLRKGTYKFVCDPHATFMKGAFTVS